MTQEFVTLPREVVEQALKVLEYAANDVLTGRNAATALRAALEQPQVKQKPDAWLHSEGKAQPLYLHPQPKRKPLDEEEIRRMWDEVDGWFNFARAIEDVHDIGSKV